MYDAFSVGLAQQRSHANIQHIDGIQYIGDLFAKENLKGLQQQQVLPRDGL